jgi:hypothetical protein
LYDNQLGEMFGDMVGTINNKKTNYHWNMFYLILK